MKTEKKKEGRAGENKKSVQGAVAGEKGQIRLKGNGRTRESSEVKREKGENAREKWRAGERTQQEDGMKRIPPGA